jgi:hypothetical protein
MEKIIIVIEMDGGLVQAIHTNRAVDDLRVFVADYDVDGCDDHPSVVELDGVRFALTGEAVLLNPDYVQKLVEAYEGGGT